MRNSNFVFIKHILEPYTVSYTGKKTFCLPATYIYIELHNTESYRIHFPFQFVLKALQGGINKCL